MTGSQVACSAEVRDFLRMHAKTLGAVLLSDIVGTKNVAIDLLLCQVLM